MPMSVLEAMAERADRVVSARALAALAPSMAPHVRDEDRRRMIGELERRAGRRAVRTRTRDVVRTIESLGLDLNAAR